MVVTVAGEKKTYDEGLTIAKLIEVEKVENPDYVTVTVEPEVIPAGMEANIFIKVNKHLIPQDLKYPLKFPVILEGISSTPSERTVTVSIENGF